MPIFTPEQLHHTGVALFRAAGASAEEAQVVVEHLVGANLAGHDSHGMILLPTYIARIKRGDIVPGAPMTIEQETPTSARINGNWDSATWSPRGPWRWLLPRPNRIRSRR